MISADVINIYNKQMYRPTKINHVTPFSDSIWEIYLDFETYTCTLVMLKVDTIYIQIEFQIE